MSKATVVNENTNAAMEGFEESEITLQSIPILALAQSMTPEVSEGATEGLVAGVLMNNTTKTPMGTSIELVAYKLWPGRTKFPPRGDNGPIECFSPDGINGKTYGKCSECAYADFNLKDKCQDQRFFIVAPVDNPTDCYRMIFAKSNAKIGKILENTLKAESKKHSMPIFGTKFVLSTKKLKNEKANAYYYAFDVKPSGAVDTELIPQLRVNFQQMTELRKNSLEEFYSSLEEGMSEEEEVPGLEGDATEVVTDGPGDALL